jgi:hypothetical protein
LCGCRCGCTHQPKLHCMHVLARIDNSFWSKGSHEELCVGGGAGVNLSNRYNYDSWDSTSSRLVDPCASITMSKSSFRSGHSHLPVGRQLENHNIRNRSKHERGQAPWREDRTYYALISTFSHRLALTPLLSLPHTCTLTIIHTSIPRDKDWDHTCIMLPA